MTKMTLREAMKNYDKARRAYWKNDSKLKDCYVTMDDLGDFVDEHNQYVVFNPTFLDDDWEEYIESPLDDKEKEYLENILRPFRHRVKYIKKLEAYCGRNDRGENIFIRLCGKDGLEDFFSLPYFPKGSMYKNMEVEKEYNLEELGL